MEFRLKALVTGGAGFVGSHLARRLVQLGWTVSILDIADAPADLVAVATVHRGSVLDTALTDRLIAEADVVIHMAGIAEPMRYGEDPLGTMDVNLLGSIAVARQCAQHGRPLLFASTSEIYGVNPQVPWREDADRVLGPVSNVRWCYSSAKAAAEHYLQALRRKLDLDYTVVRFFNIYGPGLRGRVVDGFIHAALAGEPIVVHGDGQQTRCFCYIDDAVEVLVKIASQPVHHGATYNIGSEIETSVADLARTIIRLIGSASPLNTTPYSDLYDGFQDVIRRQPDIGAVRRDFDWSPTTSVEDGLSHAIAAARGQEPDADGR
jgi:nucleoside-diphosphate-sugar epimerase